MPQSSVIGMIHALCRNDRPASASITVAGSSAANGLGTSHEGMCTARSRACGDWIRYWSQIRLPNGPPNKCAPMPSLPFIIISVPLTQYRISSSCGFNLMNVRLAISTNRMMVTQCAAPPRLWPLTSPR